MPASKLTWAAKAAAYNAQSSQVGVPSPADEVIAAFPHLRIDNTERTPEDVAAEVLAWLRDPSSLPS